MYLQLGTAAFGAYEIQHSLSGGAARDFMRSQNHLTADEIGSRSAKRALEGTLLVDVSVGGFWVGYRIRRRLPAKPTTS
jgi:hypothetical protein